MKTLRTLSIDIETRSGTDLSKSGVYRYVEDPDFDMLLFGYSADDGPVRVIDLACGECIPENVLQAVADPAVIKWAYNASFERICFSSWLRRHRPDLFRACGDPEDTVGSFLDPASWRCSRIWAAYLGLPLSLEGVGSVLKLRNQKLSEGKSLLRFFCSPLPENPLHSFGRFHDPRQFPEKWAAFKSYNLRDVEVEHAIRKSLSKFPVPETVWEEYHLSERINDRGIALDRDLVARAVALDESSRSDLMEELKRITGLENPNSVVQMKRWLTARGVVVDSLDKKSVSSLLASVPPDLAGVLSLRQRLSRSSVKKYQAMENCVCADSRCRGMFQFYGANRSGRWAGRLVQLQNLPQNHLPDLALARQLVKAGDAEMLRLLYGDVPDTLSQLIRTAFVPRPGYTFLVADFSAIEARVLARLAGETWRTEVFRNNGDIYSASASAMFHVPVEKHGVNAELRQKGKIAELALGYGGGVGALAAMGALEMGLKEEELISLVNAWRNASPRIVSFWWDVDDAVRKAIRGKTETAVRGIRFRVDHAMLFIDLPSGRSLSYVKPKIEKNPLGGQSVTYEGIGAAKKWKRLESYGPKFVENIVQAISRDLLCSAMRNLRDCFICGHVHDELIIEAPPSLSLEVVRQKMSEAPSWLPGILLNADGYITPWYCKR